MDSVSSSPTSGHEFGHLPRTPASNRSKHGRTSNGNETFQSGSLHKRLYSSLRFRSRSLSRSSDNGSPDAKAIKRRKSIVDLLNLSSHEHQNDRNIQHPPKIEATESEHKYSDLFSDMPEKRRSLRNLLNPTNILETITSKTSQKQKSIPQDSPVTKPGLMHEPLLIFLPKKPKEAEEIPTDAPDTTTTNEHQNEGDPMYAKLAEGSVVDIDLFESRLVRILDGIIAKKPEDEIKPQVQDSCLNILEECETVKDGECSGFPDFLRPMTTPRNQTSNVAPSCNPDPATLLARNMQANDDGEKSPKTPESYLRLLIDSCGGPSRDDQLPSSVSSLLPPGASPDSHTKALNEGLNFNEPFVNGKEVECSSSQATPVSFVRSSQYQLRETTPDDYFEGELMRQQARHQGPVVTVREVSCSSTLLDLDPEFRQRQEGRHEKYASLGLTTNSDWRCNQEEIAQSIASTVARMTRNYHSSSEDQIPSYQDTGASRQADESDSNQRCYDGSFEADLNETWDSVVVGRHVMLEGESIDGRESRASVDIGLLFNHEDAASLVDFDDLSTIIQSSISEADPQARLCATSNLIPTAEEILEDSTVLRSPLEPFFSIRRTAKMGDSLDLDKEIDFCPEYEDFLRRSYGFPSQRPSILLQQEMHLQTASPKISDDHLLAQLLLSSSENSQRTLSSAVRVRFPGTVNLLQHTEYFPSMGDALSGLSNYKLGDLANFYVYDFESRTIDAQLIDSSVPNPADLKNRGLQLHWIAQSFSETPMDTTAEVSLLAESSHLAQRQPSRCDSAWEEFASEAADFLDQPYSTSYGMKRRSTSFVSLPTDITRDKVETTTDSVFNDDFFLEDQSGIFSDQVSVADNSSAVRVLREGLSEEDVVAALELEEHVRATKTWVELAREARRSTSLEAETTCSNVTEKPQRFSQKYGSVDEGASVNPWQYYSALIDPFEAWSSKQQNDSPNQIICLKPTDCDFRCGSVHNDDSLCDSLDTPREAEAELEASTLDEVYRLGFFPLKGSKSSQNDLQQGKLSQDLHSSVNFQVGVPLYFPNPMTPSANGTNLAGNKCAVVAEQAMETTDGTRRAPVLPDIVIDHAPSCHLTTVKHYILEKSGGPEENNVKESTQTVEALYDDDSLPSEDTRNDSVQSYKCHTVDSCNEKVLVESHSNSLRHPFLNLGFESDINATKDTERSDLQENMITLADLNSQPVAKADNPSPLSVKGKSKVGALVNIFQDYGLIPEQRRGPLQMSSVSPSFSRQSSRHRGEPSGTSMGSGKVRKISATLSTGSRSIPSPVNRVVTSNSIFDRPHSRISDIDTEASFQFGEVLRKTRKHGESESEDTSIHDAEMYG